MNGRSAPAPRVPEVPQRRRTPPAALPPSFGDELDRYLAWLADPQSGSERSYRPSTIKQRRAELRLAATALAVAWGDPTRVSTLAVLVAPAHAECILEHYLACAADGKPTAFIRALALDLLVLARDWVRVSAEELTQLVELRRQLGATPTGLTGKTRQVLRELADPAVQAALLALPAVLAASTRRPRLSPTRQRQLLRTAVAIELLLHTGMRLHQLTSLRLGPHVFWPDGAQGPLRVVVPDREMRDGALQEYELVGAPQMLVQEYLKRFGPNVSQQQPHPPLFVNADGSSVTDNALADGVTKATLRGIGIRITPHLLRHYCATLILNAFPSDYATVKDVTGHRFVETTLALYGGRQRRAAGAEWNALLAQRRKQLATQEACHVGKA